MAWRVARSLDTLLAQLNALAPKRSKVSDGSIGDAAHASRTSDHNPWVKSGSTGIVTARDFTHDPAGGLDCNWLAKALIASGDKRIKYVIWNRRIWDPKNGWQAYKGTNPHDHHLHLSVVSVPSGYDSTAQWPLGSSGAVGSPITTLPVQEDDMPLTNDDVRKIVDWPLVQRAGRTFSLGQLLIALDDAIGVTKAAVDGVPAAVWREQVPRPDGQSPMQAGDLLGYADRAASLAAVRTADPGAIAAALLPGLTAALPAHSAVDQETVEAALRNVLRAGTDG